MSSPNVAQAESDRESGWVYRRTAQAERRAGLLDQIDAAAITSATGLTDRRYSRVEVSKFYAIGKNTAQITVKRNIDELAAAGHIAGDAEEFSVRAVLLFALFLRAGTSDTVTLVQRLVDPEMDRTKLKFGPGAGRAHDDAMSELLRLVSGLVGKTRVWEAGEVWKAVRDLAEWEKTAAIVMLLWTASEGANRLTRIKALDPAKGEHPMGGSVAAGLSTIIPTRGTSHGMTVGDAVPVTDAMVGL